MSVCKDCVANLFGICREEYCYTERAALVERARRTADQLGHELTGFTKTEEQPVWQAQCTRCGRRATVTIDPEPGQPPISGEAVRADCPTP
jgi:hypothetical protein